MKQTKIIPFTKMHGLGNDFMIVLASDLPCSPQQLPIQQWANRHLGIGFDQLLLVQPLDEAGFYCQIFNADGSEAEQCGNGLRCVAQYVYDRGLIKQRSFPLATRAGVFPVTIQENNRISVALGVPQLQEQRVAIREITLSVLRLGNPHAIVNITDLPNAVHLSAILVDVLGQHIAAHDHFPEGVNVGFVHVIDRTHIQLRTYERGSGETNACGSNACAAVAVGISNGWLDTCVTVELRYGELTIEWPSVNHAIVMTGPATQVFRGEVVL